MLELEATEDKPMFSYKKTTSTVHDTANIKSYDKRAHTLNARDHMIMNTNSVTP